MDILVLYYLVLINAVAFLVVAWDKFQSKKKNRRISERGLFNVAGLGGSLGFWLGMFVFRHKTKKLKFSVGIPALLGVQGLILLKIYERI